MLPITKFAASKGAVLRVPPFRFLWAIAAFAALSHGFAHAQVPQSPNSRMPEAEDGFPGQEQDLKLFEDGDKWLQKRMADADCRRSLGDAEAAYRKAPSEKTFKDLAPLAERCGRCATRAIERVTKRLTGGKTQRLYISDGSCWFGDVPAAEQPARKIIVDLRTVRRYPATNNGYRAVLQFFKTEENGAKTKEIDKPEETSPFFAFIAVRGPELVGPTVVTYFVKNTFEAKDNALWLTFRSQPRPEKLVVEGIEASELPVVSAGGQWFVKPKYYRYTTVADFGFAMPTLADNTARRTLLEMLVETLRRGDMQL